MNVDEAVGRLEAIQAECDRDDLRHTVINGPTADMTKAQIKALCMDNMAFAADIQSSLGLIWDHAAQALEALKDDPVPPEPTRQFVWPVEAWAVYGQSKWLFGSLGVDMFLLRETPVMAPIGGIVEEVIGGTGLNGGAELILSAPDKSWAFRFRHVHSLVPTGTLVAQGQEIAQVMDVSLDQLGPLPYWAEMMPDGWQHLDLSVNSGTDWFSPVGGGGGNYSAYNWLQLIGYQGVVLARTPGPPDAGR